MSKIGNREREVIALCQKKGGKLTKKEAVAEFGHWYYHNCEKWIGEILSRLVKRNIFEREKNENGNNIPGKYMIRKTPVQGPVEQTSLF